MKIIKTRLGSKMGNKRLNTLLILSIEQTLVSEKVTAEKSNFQGKVV